jgi:hypothetical protein
MNKAYGGIKMTFSIKQLLSAFLMFSSVLLIQGAAQEDRAFSTVYFAMREKLAEKIDCHVEISDISCNPTCPVEASMRVFKDDQLVEQTKNSQAMHTDYKTLYSGVLAQVNLYGEADVVITPKPDYSCTSSHKSQSKRDAKLLQEIWDISRELSRFLPVGSVYRLRLNLCDKKEHMQDLRVHFISQSKVDLDRLEKATETLTALKTGIGRLHGQAQFNAVFDKSLFAVEKKDKGKVEQALILSPPEDDIVGDSVEFPNKEEEPVLQIPVQPEELKKPSISFASKVFLGLGIVVAVAVTAYCCYSWWTKDKSIRSE